MDLDKKDSLKEWNRYRFSKIIVTEEWCDVWADSYEEALAEANRLYVEDWESLDIDGNTIYESEFRLEEIGED